MKSYKNKNIFYRRVRSHTSLLYNRYLENINNKDNYFSKSSTALILMFLFVLIPFNVKQLFFQDNTNFEIFIELWILFFSIVSILFLIEIGKYRSKSEMMRKIIFNCWFLIFGSFMVVCFFV